MSNRRYWLVCDDNCKFEGMTKEQTLAAIQQAVSEGKITDVDSGFITVLKEQNARAGIKLWIGTQAEYNTAVANGVDFTNVFCLFTDDTTEADILAAIKANGTAIEALQTGKVAAGYGNFGETNISLGKFADEQALEEALTQLVAEMKTTETRHILFELDWIGSWYWDTTVFKSSTGYAVLSARSGLGGRNCKITKALSNGVWQPIEWENPPMEINVEYRTTERWNKSVVYTKLLSFTTAISTTGNLDIGSGAKIFRWTARSNSYVFPAPVMGENYQLLSIRPNGFYTFMLGGNQENQAEDICYVQVWYTK